MVTAITDESIRARSPADVPWSVLAAIFAGGVAGALVRYDLDAAFPHRPDGFAWATFGINVSGCLLIGALVVLVTDVWPNRLLPRPFVHRARLLQDCARLFAVFNAAASVIAGLGAAALGAPLA